MKHRPLAWLSLLVLAIASQCGAAPGVPPKPRYDFSQSRAIRVAAPRESARLAVSLVPSVTTPWMATWDTETGYARMLYGGEAAAPGDLEAEARRFLLQHRAVFGLTDARDLQVTERLTHLIGETVRFVQRYRGLPVYPGEVAVSRNAGGRIYLVSSTYRPGLDVPTAPRVSAQEAARRAQGLAGGGKADDPVLVVWGLTLPFRLAWRVDVDAEPGRLDRVYLDAITGRAITRDNLMQHADPVGSVYLGNPIATPRLTDVPLLNLDGSTSLSGRYVKVMKYTAYDANQVPQGELDYQAGPEGFRLPPGDSRLGQVVAYFHVNRMHDYFRNTFDFTGRDQPMPVLVSVPKADGTPLANGYFNPRDQHIVLGINTTGEDIALDGDFIGHEYTHSVASTLCNIGNNPIWTEARSINEAMADYFSCTVIGDAAWSEYASGRKDGAGLRDLTSRHRYPEEVAMQEQLREGGFLQHFPEEHHAGMIWAGALWDLRRALGAAVVDRIAFAHLPLLPDAATFSDARVALQTADQQLGTNARDMIAQVFDNRGIAEQKTYTMVEPWGMSAQSFSVGTGFISPEGGLFNAFGLMPTFAVGRRYALLGIIGGEGDPQAVQIVFLDGNRQVVEKLSPRADIAAVNALGSNGQKIPVKRFLAMFQVPEGLQGQYELGVAVSYGGNEFTVGTLVPAWVVPDRGPAPPPPTEVATPQPQPAPTPQPVPEPPPPAVTPTSIVIVPPTANVPVGQEQRFSATVTDAGGQVVTGAAVTWSVEGTPGIASISQNGILSAERAGSAAVVARIGAVEGRAQVTVEAAAAPPNVMTWTQLPGTEGAQVLGLAAGTSGNAHVLYEVGLDGSRRSVNGQPFEWIGEGASEGVIPVCVTANPADAAVVYVGTLNLGLFKSFDGGTTWWPYTEDLVDPFAFLFYGTGFPAIVSVATDISDSVLVGTMDQGTLFRASQNHSWIDVSSGLGTAIVTSCTLNKSSSALYAGTSSGAYRIAGEPAWQPIVSGMRRSANKVGDDLGLPPYINQITVSPIDERMLLVGTDGDGVFLSTNEGASWTDISGGLPDKTVYAVAFDPVVPGRIFVGTSKDGVYFSTDNGASWQASRGGLTSGTVTSLVFDPVNPRRLYAGTLGQGVWALDLSGDISSDPTPPPPPPAGQIRVRSLTDVSPGVVSLVVEADAEVRNLTLGTVQLDLGTLTAAGPPSREGSLFGAGSVSFGSNSTPSRPEVAFSSPQPVSGPGVLFTLPVNVPADRAGQTLPIGLISAGLQGPSGEVGAPTLVAGSISVAGGSSGAKGDVSGNGRLDITDVVMVLRAVVGLLELTPPQAALADVDADSRVSVVDATRMLMAVAGLRPL